MVSEVIKINFLPWPSKSSFQLTSCQLPILKSKKVYDDVPHFDKSIDGKWGEWKGVEDKQKKLYNKVA